MRTVFLIALALSSGCVAIQPASFVPSQDFVSLSFRDANEKPFEKMDGLWYVDKYRFKASQSRIYVAPGHHSIGYQCPGWTSWDDFASVEYQFEAGKNYKIVCERQGPVIYSLAGGGAT